jgi:uncharacterized protein (DUF111 family)
MSRRLLYLDCAGGAAGDMVLCALAEAADCAALIEELPTRLGFPDVTLDWPAARPGGFAARRLQVHFDPAAHPRHRNLSEVTELLDRAAVSPDATSLANRVFGCLAQAEGEVHGEPVDKVHFHEVGAVDAVIDCPRAAGGGRGGLLRAPHGARHGELRPRHSSPAGPGGGGAAARGTCATGRRRG